MLDSLYGSLLGQGPAPAAAAAASAAAKKPAQNDMFSEPANRGGGGGGGNQQGSSASQGPQAFSAAKLMMPPVRKKAEPMGSKRPMMPALDIQKLQEEKEALMRQRAAASEKPAGSAGLGAGAGAGLGLGRAADDGGVPATASTAPAQSALVAGGGASTISKESLYGPPDEEYDPAKPNDYDEFCRRRMRQKAEEEMERRRQEVLARTQQAAKPVEPKEDDFATKMMKKMGWKDGQGLGKEGQGVQTPLVLQKTDKAAGKIVEGQKRQAPVPAGQPEAKKPAQEKMETPPTCVLLLNNLVGKGEVDEDLEEETAEEAAKYGKVKKCVIKELKNLPDSEAVRIFLEFTCIADATKALVDMNGRYFGGRVVRARFFDTERFAKGDLDKRTDE